MRPWCWLVLALALGACTPLTRTAGPYESKAVKTAASVRSAVESDLLLLEAVRMHRTIGPFVAVAASDAEDAASSAASTFLSIQPPDDRSDQIRDELSHMLDATQDVLATVRIAARRGDERSLQFAEHGLRVSATELDRFRRRHGS